MRLPFKPAFWPTVFTLPAVLLMLGLGVWQLERLQWKEALIAERTERIAAAPIALPGPDADVGDLEYRHLAAQGEFLHDKEMFLGARSMNGNTGYHVITPFKLADGRIVLVDRGWIPLERKTADKRAAGNVAGPVDLDGVLRLNGRQTWFVPDNRPDLNFFFWVDLPAMAKLAGLPDTETRYFVEAGNTAQSRRLSHRRADAHQPAQRSSAICHHLVQPGDRACGDLCPLSPAAGQGIADERSKDKTA